MKGSKQKPKSGAAVYSGASKKTACAKPSMTPGGGWGGKRGK